MSCEAQILLKRKFELWMGTGAKTTVVNLTSVKHMNPDGTNLKLETVLVGGETTLSERLKLGLGNRATLVIRGRDDLEGKKMIIAWASLRQLIPELDTTDGDYATDAVILYNVGIEAIQDLSIYK